MQKFSRLFKATLYPTCIPSFFEVILIINELYEYTSLTIMPLHGEKVLNLNFGV